MRIPAKLPKNAKTVKIYPYKGTPFKAGYLQRMHFRVCLFHTHEEYKECVTDLLSVDLKHSYACTTTCRRQVDGCIGWIWLSEETSSFEVITHEATHAALHASSFARIRNFVIGEHDEYIAYPAGVVASGLFNFFNRIHEKRQKLRISDILDDKPAARKSKKG